MEKRPAIDLVKMALYILKRSWLLVICAAIGFGAMYWWTIRKPDTYTASGTMYVYNGNPNLVNYQYTSVSDLNSAVQLLDTYMVVIKSNKVMDVVVERLTPDYPGISAGYISRSLSMGSVSETGVMRVLCRTNDPQKSADICNAVLDVAPSEIIRVVGAGNIEIVDYATAPLVADGLNIRQSCMVGILGGAVAAGVILVLIFLLNQRIDITKDLTSNYTLPVLSEIRRMKEESEDPSKFLLTDDSPMDNVESYAKLRMNLFYLLVGKENHAVAVTSGISGEGKSTIAANLAISCAMSDRKVLLIDADMRRACQQDLFHYKRENIKGLSDVLVGSCTWQETIIHRDRYPLDHLPAGRQPPNPAEMLESKAMKMLLEELGKEYDLILLDTPPINIVSDPLAISSMVAGAVFVVRQGFSDHREIRKALITSEMAGLDLLGFVFYGEKLQQGSYYSRKYYKGYYNKYYHKYDTRGGAYAYAREHEKAQRAKKEAEENANAEGNGRRARRDRNEKPTENS